MGRDRSTVTSSAVGGEGQTVAVAAARSPRMATQSHSPASLEGPEDQLGGLLAPRPGVAGLYRLARPARAGFTRPTTGTSSSCLTPPPATGAVRDREAVEPPGRLWVAMARLRPSRRAARPGPAAGSDRFASLTGRRQGGAAGGVATARTGRGTTATAGRSGGTTATAGRSGGQDTWGEVLLVGPGPGTSISAPPPRRSTTPHAQETVETMCSPCPTPTAGRPH